MKKSLSDLSKQILHKTWKNDCMAELLGGILRTTKHLGVN
jgi:hypothetical protein